MPDPETVYETRFRWFSALGAGVWLFFLIPALQVAWTERGELAGWVGFFCTLAFGALYIAIFAWSRPRRHSGEVWRHVEPSSLAMVGGLLGLGAIMVVTLHDSALAAAVFVSVVGITVLPWRYAIPFAAVLALGSEALTRVVPRWESAQGIGLSVALGSFAVWGMWTAMRRSRDLVAAREENAQLMIGQKRARLARDLHDILGHSLTVIAVKAELADRLIDVSPERARAEVADIQRLAGDALADVRLTVDAARTLSLPVEITRARAAWTRPRSTPSCPDPPTTSTPACASCSPGRSAKELPTSCGTAARHGAPSRWLATGSPSRTTAGVCRRAARPRSATAAGSPVCVSAPPPGEHRSSSTLRPRAGSP